MDSERQPLLNRDGGGTRYRRFRPLTTEEVLATGQEAVWRRTRFCLVLIFWALMVMFLSIITCLLIAAPKCQDNSISLKNAPSVPPVHMSFGPLISRLNGDVYAF